MSGILVAPTFVSTTNLRDVNDAAKADGKGLTWDSASSKHVYTSLVTGTSTDFVLVDGSQALTANWDAGSYAITAETFVSDVSTGTAPLTVSSTTVVSNLNADKVDGTDVNDAGTSTSDLWTADKIQTVIDAAVAGLYDHKGAYNASTNSPDLDTSPSGILKGDAYTVSDAGNFFAVAVEAGDVLIADQDDPVDAGDWTIVNRNIDSSAFATASHNHAASDINSGTLAHERGGLEADISGVEIGDIVAGTGSGTMALVTATGHSDGDVLTIQADGSVDFETPASSSSLPVADTTGIAKGSSDATKIVRLECDGITTGTTRVLTVQDADGTIALTGDNIAASQVTSGTLAHERGGLEADISGVEIGDIVAGTGSGTMALVTATGHSDGDVLTIQADGSVDFETPSSGSGVPFADGQAHFHDNVDDTKEVQIDCGSVASGRQVFLRPIATGLTGNNWFNIYQFQAGGGPTVNTDQTIGFSVGSQYYNSTNDVMYVCQSASTAAASWRQIAMNGGLKTLTDEATVTIDAAFGIQQRVTLSANRALAFSNFKTGQAVRLKLIQDGTGSRSVTWPTSGVTINWIDGSEPTLQSDANASDWIYIICTDDTTSAEVYDAHVIGRDRRYSAAIIARLVSSSNIPLSAEPYELSLGFYASKSLTFTTQEGSPRAMAMSSDGTKAYVIGTVGDTIYQYTLSTAWDMSTASYASKSMSTASEENSVHGMAISSDGAKVYVLGQSNTTVYQYTLSTPGDISTGSYDSKSMSVSSQISSAQDMAISADGSKIYTIGNSNNTVYQYTLSTPYDVSTGSYASKSMSVSSQETTSTGVIFSSDGENCYVIGQANDTIYRYSLSSAWDISTGSYASDYLAVNSQDGTPVGLGIKSDGTAIYMCGDTGNKIYQYTLGTPPDPGTVDSVSLSDGDILLLNGQTTASEKGVYDCVDAADPSTWIRHKLVTGMSASGTTVRVTAGTSNATSTWVCTTLDGSDIVGTDSLTFTEF